MIEYKYEMHDYLEYPSPYQIYMLDYHRVLPKYNYEYKKCPFYLRYKRTDPSDKTTPYLLCEYDLTPLVCISSTI